MLTSADLERIQSLVYRHMQATPQYAWPLLCEALGLEVWVKHENHTPTGAFKVRGGLVYLDELERTQPRVDLVTATRGNHGQSIPYAARSFGRTVHVYVPFGNSEEKNRAMVAWGAQLHEFGGDFDEARMEAERAAQLMQAHVVPSFSEHLVRGVATYFAELFGAVKDLDVVYVPIGMGSGASAAVCMRDLMGLRTKIVGVVSTEADAFARSFAAGQIVETSTAQTFADGVATRVPHEQAFAILRKGLERVVAVTDDQIAEAMRLLYRTTHNVAEGAGAAATAALGVDLDRGVVKRGDKVAVILTGGNIDSAWFADVLEGRTPRLTLATAQAEK